MTDLPEPAPVNDDLARQAFMERYKADRVQELELAKFSGGFERSFLQATAVLNGGSATVFLSFIGSTLDKVRTNPALLSLTFISWITGLTLAIIAGWVAYLAQNGFHRATRNRRHVSGLEILGESYRLSQAVKSDDTPASLSVHAFNLQTEADRRWRRAQQVGVASVVLFGCGAMLALATVLTAVPVGHAP